MQALAALERMSLAIANNESVPARVDEIREPAPPLTRYHEPAWGTLKLSRISTAAVAALALGGGLLSTTAATGAPTASSHVPVVYTQGMGPAWGGPRVRPTEIVNGALWGESHMSWWKWSGSGATGGGWFFEGWYANGRMHSNNYSATVTLWGVKDHHATRFYSREKIEAQADRIRPTAHGGLF